MDHNQCKAWTLDQEKGYNNDPDDLGKATNYGVTQATYDDYRIRHSLPIRDVKNISTAEVDAIYKEFWDNAKCNQYSSPLNLVMFDTAINFNSKGAIEFLQEALNVDVDGDYGDLTDAAFKEQNQFETALTICYGRLSYRDLRVMQLASQSKFYDGWINRDLRLLKEVMKYDKKPSANIREAVLRIAYLEMPPAGYKKLMEVDGANQGPLVNRYLATAGYWPGAAWCSAFVYYCIRMACYLYEIKNIPFENRGRAGYCPYIERWARKHNILHTSNPERGDAVLFPASDGVASHIGFVTKVVGNTIYTIEGNTNEAGSYEGIGIFTKSHSASGKRYVKWWKLVHLANSNNASSNTVSSDVINSLYVNDKYISKLLLQDGASYAPVKKLCNAVGYYAEWNEENKSVYCSKI